MTDHAYDANGNTLSDASGRSFTWDFENRLTQVVNPGVGITTFRYDPFGRRIQKSGPLGTTNYLYDGLDLIQELDNSGSVLARYNQGPGLDQPLSMLRAGTTSYYQQDGLASITSLSNATSTLANTYSYDSLGKTGENRGQTGRSLVFAICVGNVPIQKLVNVPSVPIFTDLKSKSTHHFERDAGGTISLARYLFPQLSAESL